jgi:hypothetical protein
MFNFYARYRELMRLRKASTFPEQQNESPRYAVHSTDTERVIAIGKDAVRHAVPTRCRLVQDRAHESQAVYS